MAKPHRQACRCRACRPHPQSAQLAHPPERTATGPRRSSLGSRVGGRSPRQPDDWPRRRRPPPYRAGTRPQGADRPGDLVELTVDEERIVLATLDPLAAMADAETEALAQLLAGLEPADEALRELLDDLARQHGIDGFQAGLADPDDVPEVPEQPYVKPGELYLLGDHRLLCGDATKADDVARLLDGGEPTLLATDPPYGVSLDPTWRDGVYNGLGPAAQPYMRLDGQSDGDSAPRAHVAPHGRTRGPRHTTRSGANR